MNKEDTLIKDIRIYQAVIRSQIPHTISARSHSTFLRLRQKAE